MIIAPASPDIEYPICVIVCRIVVAEEDFGGDSEEVWNRIHKMYATTAERELEFEIEFL